MSICKFCYSHDNMSYCQNKVIEYKDKLKQGKTEVHCDYCSESFLYEKKVDKVTETRLER